ncbi:hypothetical protein PG996_004168 [Apiospora saccharicola]|uniref:Uncharacterized protein n=1 Tax=Apiospora saccharicola TaxID=335842 RepID=A0ABR1W3D6_9PEZI
MARVGASPAQFKREMQEAAFDAPVPGRRGAAIAGAARAPAAPGPVPAAGGLGPVPGVPPASLGPVPGVPGSAAAGH